MTIDTNRGEPLHYRSLDEVATAIRGGERTSEEVTRHILARIEATEPSLHAFAEVRAEGALADARERDARRSAGEAPGLLHGVPVAVKDLCAMEGTTTRAGGRFPTRFAPGTTATVVARLEKAGAVVVGKTQLTEGAWSHHHPEVTRPVNPWSAAHWTGVSSSGSGVAAAAGLAFATIGTDTAGSIRFPSACGNLVGLKPTWGRVSRHGVFPLADTFDHVGPMARSAVDVALVYAAIAGEDPLDPTSLEAPVGDVVAEARAGSLAGLRLGLDPRYALEGVDPVVAAALAKALERMQEAGAIVVEVRLPEVASILEKAMEAMFAEVAVAHAPAYPSSRSLYGPGLAGAIEAGLAADPRACAAAAIWRREYRGRLARLFRGIDVVVAPVLPVAPPTLELIDATASGPPTAAAPLLAFTLPFNLAGVPSITLPMGPGADGVPMGFQLVGPELGEGRLLAAGVAWERVSGLAALHPCI